MRTKEEIKEWMRHKRCLNEFYRNYYKQQWCCSPDSMEELLVVGVSVITDAFSWADSPELSQYWSDLDSDFRDWY